jgi:hypothetical protein
VLVPVPGAAWAIRQVVGSPGPTLRPPAVLGAVLSVSVTNICATASATCQVATTTRTTAAIRSTRSKKLGALREAGLITPEEFDAKKAQLLSRV